MKKKIYLVLFLLVNTSLAFASAKPCVHVWDVIAVNLTNGHGCNTGDYPEYRKLCQEFHDCMSLNDICVISKGNVFGGNIADRLNASGNSIVFGINQSLKTKKRAYCVMGVNILPVGAETSEWDYRPFTPSGGWLGIQEEWPEGQHNIDQFMKFSKREFDRFIAHIKEAQRRNLLDDSYGFTRGEEP